MSKALEKGKAPLAHAARHMPGAAQEEAPGNSVREAPEPSSLISGPCCSLHEAVSLDHSAASAFDGPWLEAASTAHTALDDSQGLFDRLPAEVSLTTMRAWKG
jgi:hypothetical protein